MPLIILIVISLLIAVIGIVAASFIYDHKAEIKDIIRIRKHARRKDKLLIDYYRIDDVFIDSHHKNEAEPRYKWVSCDVQNTELFKEGYLEASKWMDDLRYAGIKVFVRLHNFRLCEPDRNWEELGLKRPNKLTSSIMYNIWHNQNMKRSISGLTKINFANIDMKTLAVMVPVVIGVAIGIFYFMGRV